MQFPEHRPAPPTVFAREFESGRRGDQGQAESRQPHSKGGKGNYKGGKDAGKGKARKAFVTEKESQAKRRRAGRSALGDPRRRGREQRGGPGQR